MVNVKRHHENKHGLFEEIYPQMSEVSCKLTELRAVYLTDVETNIMKFGPLLTGLDFPLTSRSGWESQMCCCCLPGCESYERSEPD